MYLHRELMHQTPGACSTRSRQAAAFLKELYEIGHPLTQLAVVNNDLNALKSLLYVAETCVMCIEDFWNALLDAKRCADTKVADLSARIPVSLDGTTKVEGGEEVALTYVRYLWSWQSQKLDRVCKLMRSAMCAIWNGGTYDTAPTHFMRGCEDAFFLISTQQNRDSDALIHLRVDASVPLGTRARKGLEFATLCHGEAMRISRVVFSVGPLAWKLKRREDIASSSFVLSSASLTQLRPSEQKGSVGTESSQHSLDHARDVSTFEEEEGGEEGLSAKDVAPDVAVV